MNLTITFYQQEMKKQVVKLICSEYGYNFNTYYAYFEKFYESDFQKNAIKIVALYNDKVIGFQSFFLWPYNFEGIVFNSFQSGNSVVDRNYRGQGIFQKMLKLIYDNPANLDIDFIVGFPVEASYQSFMKTKWENPFNLNWFIKLNNAFSVLFPINKNILNRNFETHQMHNLSQDYQHITLSDDMSFIKWRESLYKSQHYFYTFKDDLNTCQIGFKVNIRKKFIKELIIGQINSTYLEKEFIQKSLNEFLKKIKKLHFITIISIAVNTEEPVIIQVLNQLNFKSTKKKIYFIINKFKNIHTIEDNTKWAIYRGDIDTW